MVGTIFCRSQDRDRSVVYFLSLLVGTGQYLVLVTAWIYIYAHYHIVVLRRVQLVWRGVDVVASADIGIGDFGGFVLHHQSVWEPAEEGLRLDW